MLSFKPRVGKVQTDQITNRPNYKWIYCNFPYIILVFTLLSPTFHSLFFCFSQLDSLPFSLAQHLLSSSLTHTLSLTTSSPCHTGHLATPRHASTSPKKKKKKNHISFLSHKWIFSLLSSLFHRHLSCLVPLFLQ